VSRHLLIVANAFRAVGCLLGIPSLLAFLFLTALKLDLARLKADMSVESGSEGVNNGIFGMIAAGAAVVAKGFGLIGGAVGWVAGILDIAAAVLTLVGVCVFFTGRGLVLHAAWARIAAIIASSGFLLISFLTMTSLRRGNAYALIPLALSIYMLWVLIRRFN
jgi:hypothetical protein